MSANQVIALLPMKAHSERVPNKNIKDFCGRPLFHWVLESLQKSKYVSKVIINTDSEYIAENATKHFSNIHIVQRRPEVCGDFVSMNEIINDDILLTQGEHYLQTHSTNPLLNAETIDRAIEQYFSNITSYDSLFSVTRIQTRLYWENGNAINHNINELLRTQDLPPVYEENSNLYIFSKNSFNNNNKRRIGLKPQMYEIDKLESIDIDELHDFKIAEMLCNLKENKLKWGNKNEDIKI